MRATRRILSWARAERPNSFIAALSRFAAVVVERAELAAIWRWRHVGVVAGRRCCRAKRADAGCRAGPSSPASRIARLVVPGVPRRQLAERHRRHLDVDVDPVQQRAADLAPCTARSAAACNGTPPRVAAIAARAGVQGRDQHEVGRETSCSMSAREIVTVPSSSGWRRTSSVRRLNSGSSSRKSTPLWARLISPGDGIEPPPTRPASLIVWCGERNGRDGQERLARA